MNGFGTSPVELMAADAMLRGEIYCQNFTYSFDWVGTNAVGIDETQDADMNVSGDADFVGQTQQLTVLNAAGTALIATPVAMLTIVISGSGRQIMKTAQLVTNITSNMAATKFPHAMPYPRLIQANNSVTATYQDLSGVAALRIQMSWEGFKVFYGPGADRQKIFHAL